MKNLLLMSFLFCCCSSSAIGQVLPDSIPPILEPDWEAEGDEEISEEELQDYVDIWEELLAHPVSLNEADFDRLMYIPGMRPAYANAILNHRGKNGAFLRKSDLMLVRGVPLDVARRMLPYITAGSVYRRISKTVLRPAYWVSGLRFESLSRMRTTLETKRGYAEDETTSGYLGPGFERYQRFRVRSRLGSAGFTMKSGTGAPGTWIQPDWNSFHLQVENVPGLRRINMGDYRLVYGMGLSMNTGYAPRKGLAMVQPYIGRNDATAFTGSGYHSHLKGAAFSVGTKLQWTAWYSNRYYAASSLDGDTVRWSLNEPQFRTENERARRRNVNAKMLGSRLSYRSEAIYIGIAGWMARTNRELGEGRAYFSQSDPAGTSFSMLSADIMIPLGIVTMTGEVAFDHNKKLAGLAGLELNSGHFQQQVIGRYYPAAFQSLFGKSFSGWSGAPKNERGMYYGVQFGRGRNTIYAHADLYASLVPRSSGMFPEHGFDLAANIQRSIGAQFFAFSFRNRNTWNAVTRNDLLGREFWSGEYRKRQSVRFDYRNQLSLISEIRIRLEYISAQKEGIADSGFALQTGFRWNVMPSLQVNGGVTVFGISGYAARVTAYEPDVALMMTSVLMMNEGVRNYLVIKWKPLPYMEMQGKIAQIAYHGMYSIGSGNELIQGNRKTDINLSMKWSL